MGTRIGIETLEEYATYFGLGQKTNIELPGEIKGTLAGKTLYESLGYTWYYGNTLSAVIGQAENNFTPLQIAKYIAMLANGGNEIDISIVKEIKNKDGSKVDTSEIEEYINKRLGIIETNEAKIRIKKDSTIKTVLAGMKSVATEAGGTAYSVFKDFPIEIGGKTGSAEAGENTNAWFVGFAPYDEPEIAIVVMIENGQSGGKAAVPARDIIAEYFGMNANQVTEDMTAIPTIQVQN